MVSLVGGFGRATSHIVAILVGGVEGVVVVEVGAIEVVGVEIVVEVATEVVVGVVVVTAFEAYASPVVCAD